MTFAPSEAARPPPIDGPTLDQLRALDPGGHARLLPRVLQTYLQTLAPLTAQIEQGVRGGDATAIAHAAHTLRSSSASIGALQLAQCCRHCESAARAEQWPEMPDDVAGLLAEARRVKDALQGMLAQV